MDIEMAMYITNYYHRFFNENENKAHRHVNSLSKLNGENESSSRYKIYERRGWISNEKEVLDLLKNGEDEFFIKTAERILKEHKNEIFLNYCPNCGKLARTPKARQCRHCEYKWFEK